jgi:hypothetical protein
MSRLQESYEHVHEDGTKEIRFGMNTNPQSKPAKELDAWERWERWENACTNNGGSNLVFLGLSVRQAMDNSIGQQGEACHMDVVMGRNASYQEERQSKQFLYSLQDRLRAGLRTAKAMSGEGITNTKKYDAQEYLQTMMQMEAEMNRLGVELTPTGFMTPMGFAVARKAHLGY